MRLAGGIGLAVMVAVAVWASLAFVQRSSTANTPAQPTPAAALSPNSTALHLDVASVGSIKVTPAVMPAAPVPPGPIKRAADLASTPTDPPLSRTSADDAAGVKAWIDSFAAPRVADPADREASIRDLARSKDPLAPRKLMALGAAGSYFSPAAIAALGEFPIPDVVRYLCATLARGGDSQILCAALGSLGRLREAGTVTSIADAIEANRRREDAHEVVILEAAAAALGAIARPACVPILDRELSSIAAAERPNLYFGGQCVEALRRVGDPAGAPALERYAQALEAAIPAEPRVAAYYRDCIACARAAAASLQQNR